MKYLRGIFYSLPVQLLFLHFRKYQILLVFWAILFSTINGSFMKGFGANALFLAPEYLGAVSPLSVGLVGIAIGVFIMCWNITTFILFSRHFTFLAATANPFLKYCINNSIIPMSFLIFYFVEAYHFASYKELMSSTQILFLAIGFLAGLLFSLFISLLYFFRVDKSILRRMQPLMNDPKHQVRRRKRKTSYKLPYTLIKAEWFLDSFISFRHSRDVSHYTEPFLESIFKRHHFAAVVSVLLAFLFLIFTGFFLEYSPLQVPAAASITILFAILIGVSGAFAYLLQSWSMPLLVLFILLLNFLYNINVIDPRNKAYGLNYTNTEARPVYSVDSIKSLCKPEAVWHDKQNMYAILDQWKKKQTTDKPLLVVINTSGGGTRSATFTMNVLQHLDSLLHDQIMNKTFLITGASGGMIGASYYRELFRERLTRSSINLQSKEYVENISEDLLNPLFSSFIARDLFAPAQTFSVGPYIYLRDRGYAFEVKLNANTHGILDKRLADYAEDEKSARIPLMLYNSVITRDGKQMLISTQPVRFMMRSAYDSLQNVPLTDPDAIDFTSFFRNQDPYNMRFLTILRMNATFPVVLPNVWLPSNPVIDVMDGGLRDNYGPETSLRFLTAMRDWIKKNTAGVLIIQIKDRLAGGWEQPYETHSMAEQAVKPVFLLQNNWYKMMEYSQNDLVNYFTINAPFPVYKAAFEYSTSKEENKAALSFHLTQREKIDIATSLQAKNNTASFALIVRLLADSVKGK